MSFFGKEQSQLCVALDVGSRAIKGVVFSMAGKTFQQMHKRVAVQMPSVYAPVRIVEELHKLLGDVIKEFGRVPSKVTAGFGSSLAEYRVEAWDLPRHSTGPEGPGSGLRTGAESRGVDWVGKARLNQKEVVAYFSSLFEVHGKNDQAMIAAPTSIEINGYIVPAGVFRGAAQNTLFALGGGARDIRFKTLVSYFPSEISSLLADMKQMLGGVPLELVPLASAYREALVHRLQVRDVLLVDIGGTSTMLVLLKDGTLSQTISFPFGISHMAQELGEKLKMKPTRDASDQLRQYSQGLTNEKMQSTIRQHLVPVLAIWSQCFHDALETLYPLGPLTGETYLCGGGAYLPELRAYIEEGEWLKNISYAVAPRVTVFEGKALFPENDLKGFFQGPEDAGLASVMGYQMEHEVLV